jgi:hypothetical protein
MIDQILRQCLCGCGATFKRPRSLPLCAGANARAWAICRALPLADELNAEARRNYRFWSSAETVRAALHGGA